MFVLGVGRDVALGDFVFEKFVLERFCMLYLVLKYNFFWPYDGK